MKKLKDILKLIISLGIGVFLIWWFLRTLSAEERAEIWESFQHINYGIIILMFFVGIVSHWFRALRWNLLIEPMGYKPKIKNTFLAVMVGYLANLAFPRLGEVVRCGLLDRYEKIPFTKLVGTVVVDRILDLITFALLFFLLLAVNFGTLQSYVYEHFYLGFAAKFGNINLFKLLMFLVSVLILCGILFFIFRKKIQKNKFYQKIKEQFLHLWEGMLTLKDLKRPGLFIFHSVMIWVFYFLGAYLTLYAIGGIENKSLVVGLAALVFGAIGPMVTPGGIGLYPVLFSETLMIYGTAKTLGYAAGWIGWTMQTVTVLIVGLAAVILLPVINKNINKK